MAFYRLPGPLCVMGAMPVDSGTLVRASTPPPGPVATDMDTDFVEKVVGRNIDGTPLPLVTLRRMYDQHVALHEEAAGLFGVQSAAARFEQKTVERLGELIAEAESPRGRAADKVTTLLGKEGTDKPATDDEYRAAVAELLSAERQMELKGSPDNSGLAAMSLLVKVSKVVSDRKAAQLQRLIEDARKPGNKVTEQDLSQAVTNVLSIERQKQLLGAADDSDTLATNAMLGEVLGIVGERRKKAVKDLLEDAKKPGSKVTEEELSKAVAGLLGIERQAQLVGASEDGSETMELLAQAIAVSEERRKAALQSLIAQTKQPGNSVTREQIQKAVGEMLATERQRQLLGAGGPDDDKEISDLLEQAVEITNERGKPAPDRPGHVTVTVGQVRILPRSPSGR